LNKLVVKLRALSGISKGDHKNKVLPKIVLLRSCSSVTVLISWLQRLSDILSSINFVADVSPRLLKGGLNW